MSYQCYDLFGLGNAPANGSGDGEHMGNYVSACNGDVGPGLLRLTSS